MVPSALIETVRWGRGWKCPEEVKTVTFEGMWSWGAIITYSIPFYIVLFDGQVLLLYFFN